MTASHSSCKDLSTAGMLVADGTLGLTIGGARNKISITCKFIVEL
jgi:hypothetical protein